MAFTKQNGMGNFQNGKQYKFPHMLAWYCTVLMNLLTLLFAQRLRICGIFPHQGSGSHTVPCNVPLGVIERSG